MVVVSKYCPLLITDTINKSANPIGSMLLNAFDVGDSPLSVTVIDGPRSTVVSASICCRFKPAAFTRALTIASLAPLRISF